MAHWTSANDKAFINRITFDFIAQLEHRIETSGETQSGLAKKLKVSDGAVSQVLNLARINLSLRTMVRYARALGMKIAIVAYDDNDPQNNYGPVGSEIFGLSWEKLGKPKDHWSVDENVRTISTQYGAAQCLYKLADVRSGWVSTTLPTAPNTAEQLYVPAAEIIKEASTAHA